MLSALHRVCDFLISAEVWSRPDASSGLASNWSLRSPAQGESRNGAAAPADSQPHGVPGPQDRLRQTSQVSLLWCSRGPSHLPSAENKIWVTRPGRRKLEMGARKNGAALTCVAASCVSWSGLKPIWTFFGHWRKHLRNLKSGRRGRRQNGECAPQSRRKW